MANSQPDVFDRLMQEIHQRVQQRPPGSYTTQLLEGGVAKMGEKITEEAAEVIEAAQAAADSAPADGGPYSVEDQHVIYEACDLIYHLWVLLGSRQITVDALRDELHRRAGVSGLREKASRKSPDREGS